MSKCARDYALSLANPSDGPRLAGIPHGFSRPSQRVRVFAKGMLFLV